MHKRKCYESGPALDLLLSAAAAAAAAAAAVFTEVPLQEPDSLRSFFLPIAMQRPSFLKLAPDIIVLLGSGLIPFSQLTNVIDIMFPLSYRNASETSNTGEICNILQHP